MTEAMMNKRRGAVEVEVEVDVSCGGFKHQEEDVGSSWFWRWRRFVSITNNDDASIDVYLFQIYSLPS